VRGLGFLLLLVGIGLMAYGAAPLIHNTNHNAGAATTSACRLTLVDSMNRTLSFTPGYTWSIDVAVSGSPPSIVSIEATRYESGSHPMGASGLRVVVYLDGSMVYNGTAALGSDGLYHALADVPPSYVDGESHTVTAELYTCSEG
jgi:hypothetical protein